ncbi:CPBP family intramembrane glutamic endopeptidase [Clostridium grantii]|uniref:CAAX protease self-immunity n=1 Tax=Clostridium grantii DSM 8605 TaxID=1121316 RepID=A0A1M5XE73_9CLOT|nr:type II CAAX endopeptidase family protein [Clostridium grantii]SHH98185.1 CAAX protease self-immunity [Clostridium grantii DSM 8605]
MKKYFVIISTILSCLFLFFIEQNIGASYIVKTITKIILFTLVPYIYFRFYKKQSIKKALNLSGTTKKHFSLGMIFGVLAFVIVLLAYFILRSYIDIAAISYEMQTKSKITPANFILVGAYITFGNSFLEEFFFRGYVFLNLYEMGYPKIAYIFSALAFALYHLAIFRTWFDLPVMILALFGLISVGIVFNWLDTKSKNFINSWILHILADSAIILIGMKMFEII